eukprot:scaffold376079_cov16-Prasinocladus_malaysianus.AAC.1
MAIGTEAKQDVEVGSGLCGLHSLSIVAIHELLQDVGHLDSRPATVLSWTSWSKVSITTKFELLAVCVSASKLETSRKSPDGLPCCIDA